MKPLRLHTKISLLSAAILIIALVSALVIIINQFSRLTLIERRERAILAAITLATETAKQEQPNAIDRAKREATIMRNARRDFTAVRIYELFNDKLTETAQAEGSRMAEAVGSEEIAKIKKGEVAQKELINYENNSEKLFRVLAPIIVNQRRSSVIGAVEVEITLQPALATVERFSRYILLIIGATIFVVLISSYGMLNFIVYKPIKRLLLAMQRVERGELDIEIEARAPDELGLLTRGFNRMLLRLREMITAREHQKEQLTIEVGKAKQEIWDLTGHMSQMERLAIAGQTAAQFAHEVGTPLHIINGHVQLLKLFIKDEPKEVNRVEIISEQVKRIENIVRTMLDKTRQPELKLEKLSPNAILEKVCEAIAPTVETRSINFATSFALELPNIFADPEHLQQAFLNLLNNALDATPSGGVIKVATKYESASNEIVFEISDTGSGMSEEVAAHIFDPLYTTKEKGHGTGLGLVIVKQVVREHNGHIEFDTKLGEGTTFRLKFPVS